MTDRAVPRWQSMLETAALLVISVAIAWIAWDRSRGTVSGTATRARSQSEPARKAELPLPSEPVSLAGAPSLGSPLAKVGLVIYSDFECPFCAKFAIDTLPAIQDRYVRTGKVLIAFRQFPLPNHKFAQGAAEAALCAGLQGKFWPFHDDLFASQNTLDTGGLTERAMRLRMNPTQFTACLDGQTKKTVQAESAAGRLIGVAGTPTFLVGPLLDGARLKVAKRFSGAQPFTEFQAILDPLTLAAVARD